MISGQRSDSKFSGASLRYEQGSLGILPYFDTFFFFYERRSLYFIKVLSLIPITNELLFLYNFCFFDVFFMANLLIFIF